MTRLMWTVGKVKAAIERHEAVADIVVAVVLVLVLGLIMLLAMGHDSIWYDGLGQAQRYAAGGY